MPDNEPKAEVRRAALARRDALGIEDRLDKSLAIAGHGGDIAFDPGAVVSGFMPIRSEPDIRPLMADLADRGARLCLPAVVDRTTIVFRELVRGAPMIDTGFGTLGPSEDATRVDPAIMLMPMAAFDRYGNRIGYGAGHYDRAIARLHMQGADLMLVGIAFDTQEVDHIPVEAHDIPLHAVLTESGLRMLQNHHRTPA